jgi:hypothetical protein
MWPAGHALNTPVVMDNTEKGFEGTVSDSTNVGSVNFRDFLDTLVLSQVARKERFCGRGSNCRVFKDTGILLAVTG